MDKPYFDSLPKKPGSASVILFYEPDQEILVPIHPNGRLGFFGGIVEAEETYLQAARRELEEESGLKLPIKQRDLCLIDELDYPVDVPDGMDIRFLGVHFMFVKVIDFEDLCAINIDHEEVVDVLPASIQVAQSRFLDQRSFNLSRRLEYVLPFLENPTTKYAINQNH